MLPLVMPSGATGGSYDLANAAYGNRYAQIDGQASATPFDVQLSSDGTSMYVLDGDMEKVYQYTLSTAWDVSTASYASKSYTASAQMTSCANMRFSDDGTKMYLMGPSGAVDAAVYQYTLSSAWDVSTASYASKTFNLTTQITNGPRGLCFADGGAKMYAGRGTTGIVYQYTLGTPWDLATVSYAAISEDLSARVGTNMIAIELTPDGTRVFTSTSAALEAMSQLDIGTPYNISTTTYNSVNFDPALDVRGFCFGDFGKQLYVVTDDRVWQYRL